MKKTVFILFVVLVWLQYSFWFGKHGIYEFFCIKNDVQIKSFNDLRFELKFRNSQLFFEVNDLNNNPEESIEERARNDLAMIKADEIFYSVVSVKKNIND